MLVKRSALFLVLCFAAFMMVSVPAALAADNVPSLLITELIPNGKNMPHPETGKSYTEAMEMVEIYNNSGKDVPLKDFYFLLVEPGKEDKPFTWAEGYENKVMPANSVLVVWCKREGNPFTYADFFNYYTGKNSDLKEVQTAVVDSQSMTNSTPHTLYIVANDGTKIAAASYDGSAHYPQDDTAIKYAYPTDGSIEMRVLELDSPSTPGVLDAGQVQ